MNKQKFKYICLAFLFTLTLFTFSTNSHAGDSIKKITASELKAVLENNKGKVVILDLWATWCPPCSKEIPGFINLYNKYRDKGLEIIGVSFDENGLEVVPPFMKKLALIIPSISMAVILHRCSICKHTRPRLFMEKTAKWPTNMSVFCLRKNLKMKLTIC